MKPEFKKENIVPLFDSKFIKVFDLQYAEGKHYYDATRRSIDDLTCLKTDDAFKLMLPDAVTCFVILKVKDEDPKLLMSYEYRYPTGQFLLSPSAGLIDPEDRSAYEKALSSGLSNEVVLKAYEDTLLTAAKREIFEETGIDVKAGDKLTVVNPLVFSTPGMTDESNGLVEAVINLDNLDSLNQNGAVGSELFNGFKLLTKEEAKKIIKSGRDEFGNFYSVYAWSAMMYFVSGLWEE